MPELSPGTIFAGHRIEDVAGQGGMGTVYRATHLALDHLVALKVISPSLASDEAFRERFRSESRIAASLRHPNIVPIHHAGEEDGLLFVTMDLINGPDLRALISGRGPLEPEQAVAILEQVAAALDEAHGRGLVHRDVKPANVLIELRAGADHAYLTDFGLTKRTDQATMSGGGLTSTGAFVGTLDYVAPEQIRADRLDARTDVYALGCLFYEMLSGAAPFADRLENVAKIYAHLTDEPPALPAVISAPAGLDLAISRATAKEPDERFPSAGDFARAARAALEGEAVTQRERNVGVGSAAPTVEATTPPESTMPIETPTAPDLPLTEPLSAPAMGAPAEGGAAPGPPVEADVLPLPDGRETEVVAAAPTERAPVAARRSGRPKWGRILAVVGLLAGLAAVGVLALSGGDGDPGADATGDRAGNGGSEEGGSDGAGAQAEVVDQPIPVSGWPVGLAGGAEGVFTVTRQEGLLQRVDTGAASLVAGIGSRPEELEIVGADLWATLSGSNEVAVVAISGGTPSSFATNGLEPRGIAFGDGRVYVTNALSDEVSSFDAADPSVAPQVVAVEGDEPHGIAFGGGSVWVTNRSSENVLELDPGTLTTRESFDLPAGANPKGVLWADGRTWVANTDAKSITVIEDGSARVIEDGICEFPKAFVSAFDAIWLSCGDGQVLTLDPESGEVDDSVELPVDADSFPEDIAASTDPDRLWVSTGKGDTVVEIDPGG